MTGQVCLTLLDETAHPVHAYVPFCHKHVADADCRAVNNALLDTYLLKSLDGVLESISVEKLRVRRQNGKFFVDLLNPSFNVSDTSTLRTVDHEDNFPMREPYDRIISCLGFRFNDSLFSQ